MFLTMDAGQLRAAEAAEARRLQLGLTQSAVGVDAKTWREFTSGAKWPRWARTQAAIEAHLNWRPGALQRIADGGDPEDEDIDTPERPRQQSHSRRREDRIAIAIRAILDLPGMDAETKLDFIRGIVGSPDVERGQEEAQRRGA